jgi:hypothetical protein
MLDYQGLPCHQIFCLNYGIVEYVEWDRHRANLDRLLNPIQYTYIKDVKKFGHDKELRVSLSTIGMGHFVLGDGRMLEFTPSLQVSFDFKAEGAIRQILCAPDCDSDFLTTELQKLRIMLISSLKWSFAQTVGQGDEQQS